MVLPAALKLTPFPKSGTMKIQTSVLEPQIAANNFVRYVLEKRAILGSDSIFTFGLNIGTIGADKNPTMPVNTGIASLIKNCTLRLGNVVVSRTQDWAYYDTVAKCFVPAEERALKGTVIRGVMDTFRPSTSIDGAMSPQNYIYADSDTATTPDQLNLFNKPVFSIKLSELFPALQGMQIPLGHMEDNMVVEFELHTQSDAQEGVLAVFSSDPSHGVLPNYEEMTMLADYLSFSDATHEEIDDQVNGGKGLLMPFHEIITIRGNVPALGSAPSGTNIVDQPITQELGLAGRTVKSIVVTDTNSLLDPEACAKLGMSKHQPGAFSLLGHQRAPATQVKVNDLNVFPRPLDSVTTHLTEVEKCFSGNLAVTRPEYDAGVNFIGISTTDSKVLGDKPTLNGMQCLEFGGQRHVEGVSLITDPMSNRGTPILDKPVRYERTLRRTDGFNNALTTRYFCAVEKAFQIKDGMVSVMA